MKRFLLDLSVFGNIWNVCPSLRAKDPEDSLARRSSARLSSEKPRSRPSQQIRIVLNLVMLWAVGSVGFATTVIPPTFDELVDRAEIIFEGRVTAIESRWVVKDENRAIKTLVTFEVLEALKGEIDATYTLEVLGGTVGDVTLTVEGAPIFAMGDRNLLFVTNNGTQFVPLVGIMHGSYRFKKDPSTNKDVVLKHDGELLREVSELGKEKAFDGGRLKRIMPQAAPMTAETFKEKIRTKTQGSKR